MPEDGTSSFRSPRESRDGSLREEIGKLRERLRQLEAERPAVEERHAAEGGWGLGNHRANERDHREAIAGRTAEAESLPRVAHTARADLGAVEQALASRRELAQTAARVSPPHYIKAELGERSTDPAKAAVWDRGVSTIERYRQDHGITDSRQALGSEPRAGIERVRRQQASCQLRQAQRKLGLDKQVARSIDGSRGIGR